MTESIFLSYPWLLLLILAPPVLRFITPPYRESRQAIRVPWFQRMATLLQQRPSDGATIADTKKSELLLFWVLFCGPVCRIDNQLSIVIYFA